MKKIISGLLIVVLTLGVFTACGGTKTEEPSETPESVEPAESVEPEEPEPAEEEDEVPADDEGDTYLFTDGAGREVELPKNITRIAPSGPMAQTTLLTIAPDKLVAIASGFDSSQEKYFSEEILNLPELGNLYAETLNLEGIMISDPEVIIDIGEPKDTVVEDMDRIQDQTGIPTIFIHLEIDNMAEAYRTLGELLDETQQGEALATYVEQTLAEAKEKSESIPEEDRVSVYYGGDDGLTAFIDGTVHSDVLTKIGADNVAKIESNVRGGGAEISMEQLLVWDPDFIIFVPDTAYDTAPEQPEWAEVRAIKENNYVEGPMGPYNWMGRPPSVSRIMGIKWAGNLIYPEVFDYDMIEETKEFFELFYHYEVTDEEVREILSNSTFKD